MALDIVMITFGEPNAERNWKKLKGRFKFAKRVDGVKGIQEAHKAAAELADTNCFYVVDGDNDIADQFWFEYTPNKHDEQYVHIFRSINSVNRLQYGNGGVKIFNKSHFDKPIEYIDFATTVAASKIHEEIASWTVINTTALQAYRAGFREAAKLTKKILGLPMSKVRGSDELRRLNVWCTDAQHNAPYAGECMAGAQAGAHYARAYSTDDKMFAKINDFDFIKDVFDGIRFKV
jgi:hypothetical protein